MRSNAFELLILFNYFYLFFCFSNEKMYSISIEMEFCSRKKIIEEIIQHRME